MSDDYLKEAAYNEELEIKLLLEAIYLKYGHDFRNYSHTYMKRRIVHRMNMEKAANISELQNRIIYDKDFLVTMLEDFSINVTEMFRDPSFFKTFREKVVPLLKTYPFIRIWHAGCSTGEEVYSMAILLQEEGLYDRVQIYATDFNKLVLEKAKEGIYDLDYVKEYTHNYQQAGGKGSFADYYVAKYDSIIFDQKLRRKITFADHNLVTDGVFGEMHVIICRNVLIYFNRELQSRVINLFYDSLISGGFLCLGSKESIRYSACIDNFNIITECERIFQKKYLQR
jgi:chemotaxis protein methyltransferase CheR